MMTQRKLVFCFLCVLLAALYFIMNPRLKKSPQRGTLKEFDPSAVRRLNDSAQAVLEQNEFRAHFSMWDEFDPATMGQERNKTQGYLIARCDEASLAFCGGWDNRINGALLAYIMANLTGRQFKFEHLKPACDLTRYLVPNKVDWYLPKSFHQTVKESKDVKVIRKVDNTGFVDSLKTMNYEDLAPPGVSYVYFLGNRNYELGLKCSAVYKNQLSWMKNLTRAEIKAAVFKRLFKLSPRLQMKLEKILAENLPSPRHRLICAHMRMGFSPSNKYDSKLMDPSKVGDVWKFLNNQSKSDFDKVFVMSDDVSLVEHAKTEPFRNRLVLTDGPVVHVDRNRGLSLEHKCAGMEKLLLDQHMLMNCDVLMIGASGISRLAAYIRGTDKDLYCLFPNGTLVPCTRDDMEGYHFNGRMESSEHC